MFQDELRPAGNYHVRFNDEWDVARFTGDGWVLAGLTALVDDCYFAAIGSRILPPGECPIDETIDEIISPLMEAVENDETVDAAIRADNEVMLQQSTAEQVYRTMPKNELCGCRTYSSIGLTTGLDLTHCRYFRLLKLAQEMAKGCEAHSICEPEDCEVAKAIAAFRKEFEEGK